MLHINSNYGSVLSATERAKLEAAAAKAQARVEALAKART